MKRRVSRALAGALLLAWASLARGGENTPAFRIQLDTIHRGYDGQTCWVHPRAGAIPGATPSVVLTMQKLLVTGSDLFLALNEMRTDDLGKSWTGPLEHSATLGRREEAGGVIVATCDFTPKWHARPQAAGHRPYRALSRRPGDRRAQPRDLLFRLRSRGAHVDSVDNAGDAGCGEIFKAPVRARCNASILPDGDILLRIYFKAKSRSQYRSTVVRCGFDGAKLSYRENGSEMTVPIERGLYEPSSHALPRPLFTHDAQRPRRVRRRKRRRPALR